MKRTSVQGLATRWYLGQSIYLDHCNCGHGRQRLCPYERPHLNRGILRTTGQTVLLLRRERVGQELITVASHLEKPLMPAKRLGSHMFYQVWCSRGKYVLLKAVFQPRHSFQVCGTAFKVAQHCSGSYGGGKVPKTQLFHSTYFWEEMHLEPRAAKRLWFIFKAAHPGKYHHSQGSPDQPGLPFCLGHHILAPL